jgi:hypothetical protein
LTEKGKKQWNILIQRPQIIYFVLDDTLINLYNLSTNDKRSSNLFLKLGYSDFSAFEAARIEKKIKGRLKN